ncbi:alpha/beta fold hydrolase [Anaerocolumna sp. MB42-C2]|uniref:alpha/beta fold hydrolase n=1 Tax=Anaerocolumna sp. MB42-C2 TaxID=3070997 RepID=UPI0027DF3DFE|nr:alpha/beta hydrolase [Anaerocolumna sp. MB42-C2]WMJ90463.1 alpha/beta hydrolase [Anaerocolumna sp. MB42-C2]
MKFHEFGDKNNPHIMLIHGGGNAWWNYLRQARALSDRYHVILPTMDGHGEEYAISYVSTEATADKLMDYINKNCDGRLFALCGVSLGGQVVIELLSRKPDLVKKAIIDGSVCYPTPNISRICILTFKLTFKFIFSEKACKRQLALMPKMLPEKMLYPKEMQDYYIQEMPLQPKETMVSIYRTYMYYHLKESLRDTKAHVMYWYGEKEMKCVKKSAQLFQSYVPNCKIYSAKGYNHGYLALYLPDEWLTLACAFFDDEEAAK